MSGHASGSSTPVSTWRSVMPMQRAEDVGDVDRQERARVAMAEPDPEREGEHERDEHRQSADAQMGQRLARQEAGVVGEEADEVAHAVRLRARAHGVTSRWT